MSSTSKTDWFSKLLLSLQEIVTTPLPSSFPPTTEPESELAVESLNKTQKMARQQQTTSLNSSSSSSSIPPTCTKGCNTAHRVHLTITRKKIPLLGRILDRFQSLPLILRIACVVGAVLWKFYVVYWLLKLLLTTSTSSVATADTHLSHSVAGARGSSPSYFSTFLDHLTPVSSHSLEETKKREVHFVTDSDQGDTSRRTSRKHNQIRKNNKAVAPGLAAIPSSNNNDDKPPVRVLHIVTALAEYNNGRRGTDRGSDRLQETFIPILKDSVSTMIASPYNYHVDVYLILGWKLTSDRRKLIEDALDELEQPVGLEIWDDATPLGYDQRKDDIMKPVTRGLARQHRFVVKDKLDHYDLFSVFEDDMRITGQHISHYLEMSEKLNELKEEAPETLPKEKTGDLTETFHGPLSKKQITRMMPGFIRVEVLLDEAEYPSQKELGPIEPDFEWVVNEDDVIQNGADERTEYRTFDPAPCCHVDGEVGKLPNSPDPESVMIWETGSLGITVRRFPKLKKNESPDAEEDMLDWVLMQPGPKVKGDAYVGSYWSGRDGAFGDIKKPGGGTPYLIAQQGGWMATREQLIDMHLNQCFSEFFPPFDEPKFHQDGLTMKNVEFWSGGYSIFTRGSAGCNMQRVISLHPDHFGKHFLYHTANNKQKSGKSQIKQDRLVKVHNYYGEVNAVVKAARKAIVKGE